VFSITRSRLTAALAALALLVPVAGGSHPGHDEHAVQNPALLSALVALGGGPERFSAAGFRRAVSASDPEEDKALRSSLGSASVDQFDEVFTFVVNDGLGTLKRAGKSLPSPVSTVPKTIAADLYEAGLHDGSFDIEQLFDTLFSPEVHNHAMVAVGRKYGQAGETAYHVVLAKLVQDLGKP
jgi:hypothetical protein